MTKPRSTPTLQSWRGSCATGPAMANIQRPAFSGLARLVRRRTGRVAIARRRAAATPQQLSSHLYFTYAQQMVCRETCHSAPFPAPWAVPDIYRTASDSAVGRCKPVCTAVIIPAVKSTAFSYGTYHVPHQLVHSHVTGSLPPS